MDLAVETKEEDHNEEENGPQRSHRKQNHSLRVSDEDQTWSCIM